jgi:hypothetical protein
MPCLVYDDSEKPKRFTKIEGVNSADCCIKHLKNLFYLLFLEQNSTDFQEITRARYEQGLCVKKMEYWYRQTDFRKEDAISAIQLCKKEWGLKLRKLSLRMEEKFLAITSKNYVVSGLAKTLSEGKIFGEGFLVKTGIYD